MSVTTLFNAIIFLQACAMSKHIGTLQGSAENAAAVADVQPRQVLALADDSHIDGDVDLIRLKDGTQAHATPAAVDDTTDGDLEPQIFLSASTAIPGGK